MTEQPSTIVPDNVRDIARARRVRQADLAETIGVSRMGIVRRLKGDTRFTDSELVRLGERLDVPVGAFFGEVPVTVQPSAHAPESTEVYDAPTAEAS